MRTYNIILNGKEGFTCQYKINDFRNMRRLLISLDCPMAKCHMSRFVDIIDEIRELPIGEEVFIISSEYEVYYDYSLSGLNQKIASIEDWCRKEPELGRHYIPHQHSAFRIKRTAKMWKYASLDYDIKHL